MADSNDSTRGPSLGDALELTIARLKASTAASLQRGAMLGAMAMLAAPGVIGCATEEDLADQAGVEEATNNGRDWAQNQGRRNTAMVQFRRESWHQYTNCASRGGCQSMDVFVKVYVKRVQGANLDQKRVGIVARMADGGGRTTQFLGRYHATHADGW